MLPAIIGMWIALAVLYQVRPRWAVVGYLLALPAFPFYWTPFEVPIFNYLSAQQVVAAGLAIGLGIETFRAIYRREPPPGLGRELLVAGLIAVWSISAFDIATSTGALRQLIWNLLFFWVPYALASRLATNERQVFFLWKWISWPALAVGALTVYEYVTQEPVAWNFFNRIASSPYDDLWSPATRADILRVQATLGQSIFLAFYLALAAVLWMVQGSRATSRGGRLWAYLAAVYLAISSLLPLARGAMIAFLLAAAVLVLMGPVRLKRDILVGVAASLGAIVVLTPVLGVVNSFWEDFILTLSGQAPISVQAQQLGTWEGRTSMFDVGIPLIQNAPLFGYGDVSVHGTWPILDVSNVFIQVGLISGPIGLLSLLAFLLVVIRQLTGIWSSRSRRADPIVPASLVAVFIVVLGSWIDSSWPGQFTQIGWLFLGVIAALDRVTTTAAPALDRPFNGSWMEVKRLPGWTSDVSPGGRGWEGALDQLAAVTPAAILTAIDAQPKLNGALKTHK